MTWVRRDDHADESGKVLALTDKAYRAWSRSISYASRDLTDGWVWAAVWPIYAPARIRGELVEAGFWHARDALCDKCLTRSDREVDGSPGAIYVHDYLDFNPPRAKVLEKRAAEVARKTRQSASRVARNPAQSDSPRPGPSRPHPVRATTTLARPRKQDPVWDVLVSIYGEPTSSGRGARNAAAKVLRDYGAEPVDIYAFVEALASTDRDWAVATPTALAKHYGERTALVAQVVNGRRKPDRAAELMREALAE